MQILDHKTKVHLQFEEFLWSSKENFEILAGRFLAASLWESSRGKEEDMKVALYYAELVNRICDWIAESF